MTDHAIHLRITGRVQNVGYRGWMIERATALGVRGWVRNRLDRSVEAVASGTRAALDVLAEACRRGPPAARVDDVVVSPADPLTVSGFEQKPTA